MWINSGDCFVFLSKTCYYDVGGEDCYTDSKGFDFWFDEDNGKIRIGPDILGAWSDTEEDS